MRLLLTAAHVHATGGVHLDLGNLPTWLGVIAASVAAYFVYQQLESQRQQLRDQQDEIKRQLTALERQQADQVDVMAAVFVKGTGPGLSATYWAVDVANSSGRPIRGVQARIELPGAPSLFEAEQIRIANGIYHPGRGFPVVRRAVTVGFAFGHAVKDFPAARILVRFTDDAGIDWEIDENLHLREIRDGRDW